MTKKEYLELVKEFDLTYDADTTSAYFKEFPICGYRPDRSNFGNNDWCAKSLIIFENYEEHLNESGHYTGIFIDKYATTKEKAHQLIVNQILFIKNKYINERLDKMQKDFK